MYSKMLKESASELTLLVVEPDETSQELVEKNISRFFKNTTYISSADEALWLYQSEKFDLILIDIDMFEGDAYRFIDNVHRHDIFQALMVCSSRINDAALVLKLLNSQIDCFISKQSKADTIYKVLSKVCSKIHDRAVLMHYIQTLEEQQAKVLEVSSQSQSPMKVEHESKEEDDDFSFFPEPTSVTPSSTQENSIYQDYFSFLESDDYEELRDQLNDIDAFIVNAFSESGCDTQLISLLGDSLMRYGNVLLHYQFFSDMGTAILEFGKMIHDNTEIIGERSGEFQMLMSGFCSGLQNYMAEVWERNSDNPKFFNDSIINDATTIMTMMTPAQVDASDGEDMFFF